MRVLPLEGRSDLAETLRRELSQGLNKTLLGDGPDLLTEHLAFSAQSTLTGRNPDLKG